MILKEAIIKNEGGKFVLYTKDMSRVLGRHDTRRQAEIQEWIIQKSKAERAEQEKTAADKQRNFGAVLANIPFSQQAELHEIARQIIPGDKLAGDGRKMDPHATVFYGLHEDVRPHEVRAVLQRSRPEMTLGRIKRFPANKHRPESDALVLGVSSPELMRLNQALREEFHSRFTNNYLTYNPHLTLAYVKPGSLPELEDWNGLEGQKLFPDTAVYSYNSGGSRSRYLFPFHDDSL